MSKTAKSKGKCKHLYVQGSKKGTRCKKSCRGEYCCDHKPKKSIYKAKYFKNQQQEKNEDKTIMKIIEISKMTDIDEPQLTKYQIKNKMEEDNARILIKKIIGYKLAMGDEETMKKMGIIDNEEKTNEEIMASNDDNITDYHIKYFPYYGNEKQAKNKLKLAMIKRDTIVEKLRSLEKIIKALKDKHKQLENI